MLDSFTWAIITGVVSGVLTTALLLGTSILFRRIVLPRYQQLVYRGVLIDGEWYLGITQGFQQVKLDLTQRAFALSGIATFMRQHDAGHEEFEVVRTMSVVGSITDRFVELSFRHTNNARLGAGVWLLEVVGDGRRMRGVQAYYDVLQETISYAFVNASRVTIKNADIHAEPADAEQLPLGLPTKDNKGRKRRRTSRSTLKEAEGADAPTPAMPDAPAAPAAPDPNGPATPQERPHTPPA